MQTHACSLYFDIAVSAWLGPAVDYISDDFSVGSSSRFPFRARTSAHTDTQTNSRTHLKALPTPAWATRQSHISDFDPGPVLPPGGSA